MVWWLRIQGSSAALTDPQGRAEVEGSVFYKMTGSGNDFIRSTVAPRRGRWPAARLVDVCDRRLGVGPTAWSS